MYAGTKVNWHEVLQESNTVKVDETLPLFLCVFSADKGSEEITDFTKDDFRAMYGNTADFFKYGQPLIQAHKILNAGGRVLGKRLVADDATLANIVVCAEVKQIETQQVDSAGNLLYLDDNGNQTTVVTDTPYTITEAQIRYYKATIGKCQNINQIETKALNLLTDTTFPLFIIADNGRGESIKKIKIIPDYDVSKNQSYMLYSLRDYENTTMMESSRFSIYPDAINTVNGTQRNMALTHDTSVQFNAKYITQGLNAFVEKVSEITKIDIDTLYTYDLLFGKTVKQKDIPGIKVITKKEESSVEPTPVPTLGELTVTSMAGEEFGMSVISATPEVNKSYTRKYILSNAVTPVNYDQVLIGDWVSLPSDGNIIATNGTVITVADVSSDNKARTAGSCVVVARTDSSTGGDTENLGGLTVTSVAGTGDGYTQITVDPVTEAGMTRKYKITDVTVNVKYDDICTGDNWTEFPVDGLIATTNNKIITVVDCDSTTNAARKAGYVVAIVNEVSAAMFRRSIRRSAILRAGTDVVDDSIDFQDVSGYGTELKSGSNGSFGNAPFPGTTATAAWTNAATDFLSGKVTDEIWDYDIHKIDFCPDANYPQEVKKALSYLAMWREDFYYFRDMNLNIYSLSDVQDMLTSDTYVDYKSPYIGDYLSSYEIIDSNSKKQIRVSMIHGIAPILVSHYSNNASAPLAGEFNNFTITEAVAGTLSYTPRTTPSVDAKEILDDLRVNFCNYSANGILTVQSTYTSQDHFGPLSFASNVIITQMCIKDLRRYAPKIRFMLVDTPDFSKYKQLFEENVIAGYKKYFQDAKLIYTRDDDMIASKIFNASLYVWYKNFAQGEIFDVFAVEGSPDVNDPTANS